MRPVLSYVMAWSLATAVAIAVSWYGVRAVVAAAGIADSGVETRLETPRPDPGESHEISATRQPAPDKARK